MKAQTAEAEAAQLRSRNEALEKQVDLQFEAGRSAAVADENAAAVAALGAPEPATVLAIESGSETVTASPAASFAVPAAGQSAAVPSIPAPSNGNGEALIGNAATLFLAVAEKNDLDKLAAVLVETNRDRAAVLAELLLAPITATAV